MVDLLANVACFCLPTPGIDGNRECDCRCDPSFYFLKFYLFKIYKILKN